MPNDFRDAQARLAKTDHDLFLGRLVWYSVSDVKIEHQELCRSLLSVGLRSYLPRPPSDVDVFRRVCSASQRKRVATSDPNIYCNYTVRDVGYDAKTLWKKIVRETVDTSAKDLSHESHMCDITFDKATGNMTIDCNGTDPIASDMATKISEDYHADKGMMNSYGVRELIRRILLKENATNVRGSGGGVYFIPEDHGDKVDALEQFAGMMGGDVLVHSLPLIDDVKQRTMVRLAFESETADEVDGLVNEMADLITEGKTITEERYAGYLDQFHALRSKTKELAEVLEDSLDTTESRLKIFQRTVMNLALQIKNPSGNATPEAAA